MSNKIIIGIISLIAVFGFLLAAYKFTNTSQNLIYPEINKVIASDHIKWFIPNKVDGSKDKKNILVEYSDLQCPACKNFHVIIKSQIETDKKIIDKVTFVYRHFPLINIHQNAEKAAYGAEAAGKQGKFFEYVDFLFTKQDEWAKAADVEKKFESYAKDLKLDIEKFKKDFDSKETKEKVAADILSGEKVNVNATPTFYLDGKKLDSIRSFDEFKQLLQNL